MDEAIAALVALINGTNGSVGTRTSPEAAKSAAVVNAVSAAILSTDLVNTATAEADYNVLAVVRQARAELNRNRPSLTA